MRALSLIHIFGFAIVVDQLMAALSRQDIDVPVIENSSLIVFEEAAYHAAIKRSMAVSYTHLDVYKRQL